MNTPSWAAFYSAALTSLWWAAITFFHATKAVLLGLAVVATIVTLFVTAVRKKD
jgi:hypothetical protein